MLLGHIYPEVLTLFENPLVIQFDLEYLSNFSNRIVDKS